MPGNTQIDIPEEYREEIEAMLDREEAEAAGRYRQEGDGRPGDLSPFPPRMMT